MKDHFYICTLFACVVPETISPGKIQRLQKKLVETRDEAEWYRTKDKLAEQQMRLDMLLGKEPDDY